MIAAGGPRPLRRSTSWLSAGRLAPRTSAWTDQRRLSTPRQPDWPRPARSPVTPTVDDLRSRGPSHPRLPRASLRPRLPGVRRRQQHGGCRRAGVRIYAGDLLAGVRAGATRDRRPPRRSSRPDMLARSTTLRLPYFSALVILTELWTAFVATAGHDRVPHGRPLRAACAISVVAGACCSAPRRWCGRRSSCCHSSWPSPCRSWCASQRTIPRHAQEAGRCLARSRRDA